jgi:hypothetical protein
MSTDDPERAVSLEELDQLIDLYILSEGAPDPCSVATKEAEQEFDSLIERIYREKALPQDPSMTLPDFRKLVRKVCRGFVFRQKRKYPCIQPERPQSWSKDNDAP